MATVSAQQAEEMLSQGSMIERIGSFLPPFRPGYSMSKYEIKVQKNVARKLYNKRIKLAEVMSAPHGNDSASLVVNPALVSSGISPNSVQKYDEYIELLSQRQGGWKRWKAQVSEELDRYHAARKEIMKTMGTIISILTLSLIVGGVGNAAFPDVEYFFIIPTLITFSALIYAALFGYKKVKKNMDIIFETTGGRKKRVEDFFPYTKL